MLALVVESQSKGEPLEGTLRVRQQNLHELLLRPDTTAEAASVQLAAVLESEAAIKQLQLRTLIGLRDALTPEQQRKALTLGSPKAVARQDVEAALIAKANKLRAALEPYLTAALIERGAAIEQLIQAGDLKGADTALDRLMAESGVNEPEVKSAMPDFSKFATGVTEVEVLTRRFEAAKVAAQQVVYLPLLRQLYAAKDAVEAAKSSQAVVKIGRILTWAEHAVKK